MGLLITIEGGEYTGKSSVVIPGIADYIRRQNIPLLVSREPGGTPEGEKMRQQLFEKKERNTSPDEMAILFNKARKLHLDQVIIPFLGKHKEKRAVVLLDRYLDSTRVYQGLEEGVSLDTIKKLENTYVNTYLPDLTLILFIPNDKFETIMNDRISSERQKTAWDEHDLEIHRERQKKYMTIPALSKRWNENREFALIDCSLSKQEVIDNAIKACTLSLAHI